MIHQLPFARSSIWLLSLGLLLIFGGAILLARELGLIALSWPLALMVLGLWIVLVGVILSIRAGYGRGAMLDHLEEVGVGLGDLPTRKMYLSLSKIMHPGAHS